jgi:DNA-binding NtrC family response regulator
MTSTRVGKVLVVDDDRGNRQATGQFLESEGFEVITVASGGEALAHFAEGISVIITDLVMPGMDGMDVLRAARDDARHAQVILMTGQGSERAAVAALKSGAFHYVTKPVNPDELASLVRQACEKHRMASEIVALHDQLQKKYGFSNIIGTSEPMRRVFEKIRMVADVRSTVLIEGESGTGKELVARALHFSGPRRKRPFVAVNCAAIPEALVESELFGHQKGAFTGAVERRTGKFQAADGGTLLIDEIGDMPIDLQSKLLRALEMGSITPIGGNKEIPVDVRIVASTHRHLQGLVSDGKFRDDLFYRLNVVNIHLPPLRERSDDIPLLVRTFVDELAAENNRPVKDVSPSALAQLQAFDWPGNVRQLRNVLESAIVTATRETIEAEDLPEPIRQTPARRTAHSLVDPGMTLERLERDAIRLALARAGGHRTDASNALGISVRTLQRKIKEYNLE